MRIVTSDVSLSSSSISIATSSVKEHLRKWDKTSELNYDSEKFNGDLIKQTSEIKDRVQISQQREESKGLLSPLLDKMSEKKNEINNIIKEEVLGDIKSKIIKDIIEAFTGKEIDVLDPDDLKPSESNTSDEVVTKDSSQQSEINQLEGWGIDYQYIERHYTREGVAFSATGTVNTVDGRVINFKAAFEISRETYDEINISFKAGDALKDPLLIDLNGKGIGFTNTKFEFDIDADGKTDQLYVPRMGNGFLFYDRNGNGIADDGSELFGPQTGNGFLELSIFDEDQNGWIDEGDSAFSDIKIWQKDAEGNDYISSIKESGIGAIYTGKISTIYNVTTNNNDFAGKLRESGIYLKENGDPGIIHEVDLLV